VPRLGAHLLQDREGDRLVCVLLREFVGPTEIERRMKAVTGPDPEPSARSDDAWDGGSRGADGPGGGQNLGGEGGAVLDAARFEPRCGTAEIGPRRRRRECRGGAGGDPEQRSD